MAERLLIELIGSSEPSVEFVKDELVEQHGFADADTLIPDHLFSPVELIKQFRSLDPFKNAFDSIKGPAVTTKVDNVLLARALASVGGKIVVVTADQPLAEFINMQDNAELDDYKKNLGKLASKAAYNIDVLKPGEDQIEAMLGELRG